MSRRRLGVHGSFPSDRASLRGPTRKILEKQRSVANGAKSQCNMWFLWTWKYGSGFDEDKEELKEKED